MTDVDKALAILQATRDGDDLRSWELQLIQAGVNGNLTEKGEQLLHELYLRCTAAVSKDE